MLKINKTHTKYISILFVFFGLNLNKTVGQNYTYGGIGYGSFGIGSFSTTGLKDLLGSKQNLATQCLVGGGGGFGYMNRFVIGGSGKAAAGSVFAVNTEDLQITHGWGGLEVGYDFSNTIKNKFITTIMLGGRGTNINIHTGSEKNKTISNGAPIIGINFYALTFLAGSTKDDVGGIGGFMFGLKAGAWISMSSSKWEYNGNMPLNKVAYAPYGTFITLTVGGGGFGIKK